MYHRCILYVSVCNNTKENFLWGPEERKFQISQVNEILLMKFYLCFHKSYENYKVLVH